MLDDLRVTFNGSECYSGRGVVNAVMRTGSSQSCSAKLETGWIALNDGAPAPVGRDVQAEMRFLIEGWQSNYAIDRDYKNAVTDIFTWLSHLRFQLDCEEARIRVDCGTDHEKQLRDYAFALGEPIPVLDKLFHEFESAVEKVDSCRLESHVSYSSRLLHPLLLSSAFQRRAFQKPLGYAGDYGIVNMIGSDPAAGGSLFSRVLNVWFLSQAPAEAHRNRLEFLRSRIERVVLRARGSGERARILSIGCGPAIEVRNFIASYELKANADFTLLDFNQETLDHTLSNLRSLKDGAAKGCTFKGIRRSVAQLLKSSQRSSLSVSENYHFVYCAGLFDYLTDEVCRTLNAVMMTWVKPGGLLVVTNVHSSNPRRLTMDYIMDWPLIYRNTTQLAALLPPEFEGAYSIECDPTGVNIYLEMLKSADG